MNNEEKVKYVHCESPAQLNLLSQEEFLERAEVIFQTLGTVLARSLGAYGAPTIISNFPYQHVTKDGYTIARNLTFDRVDGNDVDRAIAGMAMDICSRLNYAVGDGTTSAIVAVNSVYNEMRKEKFEGIRPKDLLEIFTQVKDDIVEKIRSAAIQVTAENVADVVREVVYISSNADKKITDMICEVYKNDPMPKILCELSTNSETKLEQSTGYTFQGVLGDSIYFNSENKSCEVEGGVDVIMFDHMVKNAAWDELIKKLWVCSNSMGRKLVVMAPWFDDEVLGTKIKPMILSEYRQTHDISLILINYGTSSKHHKLTAADLAMLLDTELITKDLEMNIIERLRETNDSETGFWDTVNIHYRGIKGSKVPVSINGKAGIGISTGELSANEIELANGAALRVGYCSKMSATMKQTIFLCENYDKELYKKHLEDAENDLNDVIKKYELLGTYTQEVYDARKRLSNLKMSLSTIYVGGDSLLSRDLLKDSVDDAIRAAESAVQFGYVYGCHTTLIHSIGELIGEKEADANVNSPYIKILKILMNGFLSVYRRVLLNAFGDSQVELSKEATYEDFLAVMSKYVKQPTGNDISRMYEVWKEADSPEQFSAIDCLIGYGVEQGDLVFNLDVKGYDKTVINSSKTDIEIVTAVLDLLKILTVGNQIVLLSIS